MNSVYVTICEDLDKFKTTHMTDKKSEKVSPSLVREVADFKEM